jgi:hypothetical protein
VVVRLSLSTFLTHHRGALLQLSRVIEIRILAYPVLAVSDSTLDKLCNGDPYYVLYTALLIS